MINFTEKMDVIVMKYVLAMDSFKGCLSSAEVERVVCECLTGTGVEVVQIPMSDGGEGMLEAFTAALGGKIENVAVHDPLMRPMTARLGIAPDGTAIIETSQACGLTLINEAERNPLTATTYGVGEMIAHAYKRGARNFIVGLGGSGTSDAGVGMLQGLTDGLAYGLAEGLASGGLSGSLSGISVGGVRQDGMANNPIDKFLPINVPNELINNFVQRDLCFGLTEDFGPGGDIDKALSILKDCRFTLACDVRNPLCGENGAAHVFGRQKGATDVMIALLDERARRFAEDSARCLGFDKSEEPGAGAAGGLGYAFMQYLGAEMCSGADLLLDLVHFDDIVADADVVITGEGRADSQTLMGKLPERVLRRAEKYGVPVWLLAGQVSDRASLLAAGFTRVNSITPSGMPLCDAVRPDIARENIRRWCNLLRH